MNRAGSKLPLRLAVIGAGPVGLSLALHAARALPEACVSLFDARSAGGDPARDPRIIALSLGSIRLLRRLQAWMPAASQAIEEVHVSQLAHAGFAAQAEVRISAQAEGVPQLGAVLRYGDIVAPLEAAWTELAASSPERLAPRFGVHVESVQPRTGRAGRGALVRTAQGETEEFDIAVLAEGGVFADQKRKPWSHDYRQTAWVGQVQLAKDRRGIAYERFTPDGPAALLPLPPTESGLQTAPGHRAALVWCVPERADRVQGMSDGERIDALNGLFHPDTGGIAGIGPLKRFPLGLNAEHTLCRERIAHIGNAAQTLHPVAGQGLNLGLRDAFELVRQLKRAGNGSAGGSWIDDALRRTERHRAADRWTMIAATHFLAQAFTWDVPGAALLRGAALTSLQRMRPAKSLLARRMMFGV